MGEPCTTDTFTMDCPTCGPSTVHYLDGEAVPHGCDYEPPAIVIDCADPPFSGRGTAVVRFHIDVEDCCGRWRLVRTELLAENLSRTHVECAGCGQRRTLTVTNLPARTGLEVVA